MGLLSTPCAWWRAASSSSWASLLFLLLGEFVATPGYAQAPARAVEVLVLGCDHLNQLYITQDPRSDVFSPKKQAELAQLRAATALPTGAGVGRSRAQRTAAAR